MSLDTNKQDQASPGSTSSVVAMLAGQKPIAPATEPNQTPSGATNIVMSMRESMEPAASTDAAQDEELDTSKKAVTEAIVDQKPHKYVLTSGEHLFQSLYAPEKTPPSSPGSVASSSTLVDPSSRKVSPSDSETWAKGNPTAVKDFAYPSPNSGKVLDPVAIIEEGTKKELLKQLKKKTAAEEKLSRKATKLAARNESLGAELRSAKAKVQNRDAQTDLAKTHANAMIVTNIVLRQAVQDLGHEWDQQKERSLEDHLQLVDQMGASAYNRMARLEEASVELGRGLDSVDNQMSNQEENVSPMSEGVESKESVSLTVDRQATEEVSHAVGSGSSTAEETTDQVEANVEWIFPGLKPKESAVIKEQAMADPIASSLEDTTPDQDNLSESSGEDQTFEFDDDNSSTAEGMISENDHDEEPAVSTDAISYQEDVQDLGLINANYEFSKPAGPATMFGTLRSEQRVDEAEDEADAAEEAAAESVAQESSTDAISNDVQGVGGGHGFGINGNFEFSKPAGPATMFGILRSELRESEVESQERPGDEVADVAEVQIPCPANLWGLLKSNCETSDGHSSGAESGEQGGASGDTVLDESESNVFANVQESDDEELTGGANVGTSPDLNDNFDGLYDVSDNEEDTIEPPTLSNASTSEEDSAPSLHGSLDGDSVPHQNVDAPEVAGEDVLDTIGAGPLDDTVTAINEPDEAPTGGAHVDLNDNFDDLYDVSDNEEDIIELPTTTATNASTGEKDPAPSPHGPVDGDGIFLPITDAAEFAGEDVVDNVGADSLYDTVMAIKEAYKEPIGGAHVEQPSDLNDAFDELYDVSDNEDDVIEPPTNAATSASTGEEDPASSFHGSVDSDDVAVPDVHSPETVVEDAVDATGAGSPDEAITEPIGHIDVVEEEDHKAGNGAVESVHVHETVVSVALDAPIGAAEVVNGHAANATVALEEDRQEELAAQEAKAFEANAMSEQLEGSGGKGGADLAENDAIARTRSFQEATAEEKGVREEGKTLEGSALSRNVQVTCEDCNDDEDGELQYMAIGSSCMVTAEGGDAKSGVVRVPISTPPGTPPLPPRTFSLPEPEKFEFFGPVPQTKELTKGQKRNEERKRAKAKKKSEAALMRVMEEEAAKTPEALAQRRAEEDAKLGEKRLKLQTVRL